MTIQELGSIGEFISSIVVLITLIYLAVQVRQTRNATIASTMQTNRMQFQNIMIANHLHRMRPAKVQTYVSVIFPTKASPFQERLRIFFQTGWPKNRRRHPL